MCCGSRFLVHLLSHSLLCWRLVASLSLFSLFLSVCPTPSAPQLRRRVLDIKLRPLVIMCETGIHLTGMIVGCLRRIQGWNFGSVIAEHRAMAASTVHGRSVKIKSSTEQFVELFDTDLVTLPRGASAKAVATTAAVLAPSGDEASSSKVQEHIRKGKLVSSTDQFTKLSICLDLE